jgi:choline dehydrogenase
MPSTRHLDQTLTEVTAGSIDALGASGFSWIEDHNEPGAVGVGRMPMNLRDGRRVTTAEAYLAPEMTPPNLTIRPDSLVDQVVFEGTTAVGVRLAEGAVLEAGWVVLCAGVYGSPTILLRSGIGQDGELVNLPGVGENLADHPSVYVDCGYEGPARAEPLLQVIATWHSEGRPQTETPDIMLWLGDPEGDSPEFEIGVVLLRPYSRGRVRLRSRDPVDPPVIELPDLDDPADVSRLAEGYRRALEVGNDQALRRHCAGPAPNEPDDLENFIRRELFSVPHTVGTCAMGSVVDASGNVFGAERLTVVDASIMPDVPSGFTHFPTIMIAERLAEQVAEQLAA